MKKHLTKLIFLLTMVIGLSMSVSAQNQDKKKDKPPKRVPPKIIVPKNSKPPKNNDKEKKKKPDTFSKLFIVKGRTDLS